MEAWVLGCGPSLGEVRIPPDAFSIGSNNSYLKHWSPVGAWTDIRAIRRDYQEIDPTKRPLVYFSAIDPKRISLPIQPGRPLEFIRRPERPVLRKAGVFAYWLAAKVFGATRIHMVGFDMEWAPTHFDNDEQSDWSYVAQRRQIRAIQDEFGVETWIFLKGEFHPFESLPQSGQVVRGLFYDGNERDITSGMLMPQDFWKHTIKETVSDAS